MNRFLFSSLLFLLLSLTACRDLPSSAVADGPTWCNPLPLDYRFAPDGVSRRDGSQPCVVLFGDTYYLFLSNAGGGYYASDDLCTWRRVESDLPPSLQAVAVAEMGGSLYLTADSTRAFYRSSSPGSGRWQMVTDSFPYRLSDPSLFCDGDRLFLYAGSGDSVPLTGMELDPGTLMPLCAPVPLIESRKEKHGWEIPGDYHAWKDQKVWIEGTWMNRHEGRYYLQYTSSGIQYTGSNQGVYVGDNPLGPFEPAPHNPFAYKPEGFVRGAGTGCVFRDRYGNCWYAGTVAVSAQTYLFERRLALYPLFFDADGWMHACTALGDWPMTAPRRKADSPSDFRAGWMLLSYGRKTRASSEVREHPSCCATDEDVRTWWSARSGDAGEYLQIDLEEVCRVYAVQVNFADDSSTLHGRQVNTCRYRMEVSSDGRRWQPAGDASVRTALTPHDYVVLPRPVSVRYVRVTNAGLSSGRFSVSDLRVFGRSDRRPPLPVEGLRAVRSADDRRDVTLRWKESAGADGYLIRYGVAPDKLYHCYTVYGDNEVTIRSLHADRAYYFAADSFNAGGISSGQQTTEAL